MDGVWDLVVGLTEDGWCVGSPNWDTNVCGVGLP